MDKSIFIQGCKDFVSLNKYKESASMLLLYIGITFVSLFVEIILGESISLDVGYMSMLIVTPILVNYIGWRKFGNDSYYWLYFPSVAALTFQNPNYLSRLDIQYEYIHSIYLIGTACLFLTLTLINNWKYLGIRFGTTNRGCILILAVIVLVTMASNISILEYTLITLPFFSQRRSIWIMPSYFLVYSALCMFSFDYRYYENNSEIGLIYLIISALLLIAPFAYTKSKTRWG